MKADRLNATLRRNTARASARYEDELTARLEETLRREGARTSRRFKARVTQHSLVAAAPAAESAMVALYPTPEQAVELAQPNGEPAEILHVTLAYLGEIAPDQAEAAAAVVREVAAGASPLEGNVGGIASFGSETGVMAEVARVAGLVAPAGGYGDAAYNSRTRTVFWVCADWTTDDEHDAAIQAFLSLNGVEHVEHEAEASLPAGDEWTPVYASGRRLVEPSYPSIVLPDVPGLVELRVAVCEALDAAGIPYSRLHGFTAHLSLAFTPEPTLPPADLLGLPLSFDRLSVTRGDVPRDFPMGDPALLAAGVPPDWTPPHPDEVFDPEGFVQTLHTKSDPVRRRFIEEVGHGLPIDWDVTNPLVGRVLARSGAKVTNVAETTRLNVMRTIRAAYEQGLSIPDTAKLIREGMAAAAPARARLIARTELVAVASGGSVAAAQAVSDATGIAYWKRWLVAPGAKDPRHEDYDGLDGQTVALGDAFDVGGFRLDYPGDPAGPPEEVCNCRCTVEMVESPDAEFVRPEEDGGAPPEEATVEDSPMSNDPAFEGLPDDRSLSLTQDERLGEGESLNAVFKTEIGGKPVIVKPEPLIPDENLAEGLRIRENITPGRDLERERAAYVVSRYVEAENPLFAVKTPAVRISEVNVPAGTFVEDALSGESVEMPTGWRRSAISDFVPNAEVAGAISSSVEGIVEDEMQIRNAGLFDAIIGNTDRHRGNYLLDGRLATGTGEADRAQIHLIDHGLAFPEDNVAGYYNADLIKMSRDLFGDWLEPDETAFLTGLRDRWEQLERDLSGLLPAEALQAMKERLDWMIQNESRLPLGFSG